MNLVTRNEVETQENCEVVNEMPINFTQDITFSDVVLVLILFCVLHFTFVNIQIGHYHLSQIIKMPNLPPYQVVSECYWPTHIYNPKDC